MKKQRITILFVAVIISASTATSFAVPYFLQYEEDFSSDPGWTTDQPANYFWDAGTETYHATTENAPPDAPAPPPPPPTRYTYTLIDYDGGSLKLEFDMKPTDLQWSAAVQFGLYDENLAVQTSLAPDAHYLWIAMGRADVGRHLTLGVRGSTGVNQVSDFPYNVISEGTWYRCVVEYLSLTDEVTLTVKERDTGTPVGATAINNVGGLPDDLDHLGFARDANGYDCPGASGYSCSASATAYVDNVRFSLSIPFTWHLRTIAGPSPRYAHSMAYDSCRQFTVLFGGYGGEYSTSCFEDTWEWDGNSWVLRATTGPRGRSYGAMAFDEDRCVAVHFGGSGFNPPDHYVNETWEWNGMTWTKKSPAVSPSGRNDAGMAYDRTRRVVLLFGGYHPGMLNDLWQWAGTNWEEVSTTTPRPSPRTGVAMAYDPVRDRTIVFGGSLIPVPCAQENVSDETWELDMLTSPATWTLLSPATKPSPRMNSCMVYDAHRSVMVLFGGTDYCSTEFGDTWEWDGSTWTEVSTTGPVPRWGHAMAYDAAREEVLLFGGDYSYVDQGLTFLGDTWAYGQLNEDCNNNGIPDGCESDTDGDGEIDDCDNCPNDYNPAQEDAD